MTDLLIVVEAAVCQIVVNRQVAMITLLIDHKSDSNKICGNCMEANKKKHSDNATRKVFGYISVVSIALTLISSLEPLITLSGMVKNFTEAWRIFVEEGITFLFSFLNITLNSAQALFIAAILFTLGFVFSFSKPYFVSYIFNRFFPRLGIKVHEEGIVNDFTLYFLAVFGYLWMVFQISPTFGYVWVEQRLDPIFVAENNQRISEVGIGLVILGMLTYMVVLGIAIGFRKFRVNFIERVLEISLVTSGILLLSYSHEHLIAAKTYIATLSN